MADDGDRRVEPKHLQLSAGLTATPERIQELQERVQRLERIRPKPTTAFSSVLKKKRRNRDAEEELSEKERRRRALPKNGPRPGLLHPVQRDVYGREEETEDTVVLKG